MKIGIDIDDTTLSILNPMLKYANQYMKEISGKNIDEGRLGLITTRYYLEEIFGWTEETRDNFFNQYYKTVLNECTMMPNANTIIKKLKNEGNAIHFISHRLLYIKDCNTEEITKTSMRRYNIPYDTLNLVEDKIEFSKKHSIDLFIDDCYETCKELNDNGIKILLMTSQLNSNINAEPLARVNNWIEAYNAINF